MRTSDWLSIALIFAISGVLYLQGDLWSAGFFAGFGFDILAINIS